MALILNAKELTKAFGTAPLFDEISFTCEDGERIGLIGPNGSGKSTLLKILAGEMLPDSGEVAFRKKARMAYVAQDSIFERGVTIRERMEQALAASPIPHGEHEANIVRTLGRAGFDDFSVEAATLSGGWRKRLAIAESLALQPDALLLDEPTNHLDLAGIEWLEQLLINSPFASVVISHDRYFLENVATAMAELNRAYPDGILRVNGNYSAFLEKKDEFLHAQSKRQEALENLVRREMEWLRRGAKARTTKSKARIGKANQLIEELGDLNSRTRTATANIDFTATDRKTKRLLVLEGLRCELGGRTLLDSLDFVFTHGTRVGLVGANGSGKTTLLHLLQGLMPPTAGKVTKADGLRIVYFDQNRPLDPDVTLRRALAPDADSVIYRERVIHVNAWAARFLFTQEQLGQPVGRLSGGERARVLIARLMLEPADLLLLDEPTNDLDIPTLEILEENLLEFPGALVLVTHDRYLLDRVSTVVLGLDGEGGAERFAGYAQWEEWFEERTRAKGKAPPGVTAAAPTQSKKKLSYLEAREYETIEARVAEAEAALARAKDALEDPAVFSDHTRIVEASAAHDAAQQVVDALYARWHELETKSGGA
ncbi:MAG TPA: ABC-F family ATP-binding cassette domain-containing protein [Bryobacteraceae bacterium]|nr:ABC-F family ATP-binding cassette domain-containing protein [Bryobacteraceae bacterium]